MWRSYEQKGEMEGFNRSPPKHIIEANSYGEQSKYSIANEGKRAAVGVGISNADPKGLRTGSSSAPKRRSGHFGCPILTSAAQELVC